MLIGLLFVLGAVVSMVLSETAKKRFTKNTPFFFAFSFCFFALLFFVFASGFKFDFNKDILIYSLLFGLAYGSTIVFTTLAYKRGNFFISGLVISYSLLLPTLYGILFYKNKPSIFFYIGLALLCIAIFLLSFNKKDSKNVTKNFNVFWLIFIVIAFVGNGFCSIFQTAEQNAFDGMYKNEFMIVALAISSIIILTISLITERHEIKQCVKPVLGLGSIAGLLNGALNLFVMYSVNRLDASIVFPLISGGGLILTFLIARFLFKEKYNLSQYVGFAIALTSVVFLNL